MKKMFELHQKITLVVNEYSVLKDSAEGGQKLVAFAKQKRLALREKFTLFSDESQRQALASSAARSVLDFGAVYDIKDETGQPLASVKKEFGKSLLNSTWTIYTDDSLAHKAFTLREKSQLVAILRRLWGFLPYANDIPFPIKYHFLILTEQATAGQYIKTTRFRDHYALYLEEAYAEKLDERAWMIIAVLLDAMQSR